MADGLERHGDRRLVLARALGHPTETLLDFSANLNPLGPPPIVHRVIRTSGIELVRDYPDVQADRLRQALSRYLKVATDQIIIGNGAAELIYFLTHHFQPRRALVAQPTFTEYELAIGSVGGTAINVPSTSELDLDLSAAERRLADADIAFVCNPNNPTGRLISLERLIPLVTEAARAGTVVIVDEAFMDFVPGQADVSLAPCVARFDNLIVLRSLTKIFAVAGLRLGYLVTNAPLAARLRRSRPPWVAGSLPQEIGVACLADTSYLERSVRVVAESRAELIANLERLPDLTVLPSVANFVLVSLGESWPTATELAGKLAAGGILIRDCSNFRYLDERWVRLAVRLPSETKRLVEALADIRLNTVQIAKG